jgi:hypothetical protein
MTPVLRGSGVLCYVETRVLTRVEATGIDGFMGYETVSLGGVALHRQNREFLRPISPMGFGIF